MLPKYRPLRQTHKDIGRLSLTSSTQKYFPFHRLPIEILQKVFFHHVWTNYDPPASLLLVCQLWRDKFLRHQLDQEDGLSYRMDGMVCCSDEASLFRAIERTGGAKFELTICCNRIPFHGDLVDFQPDIAQYSKRCRLLRIMGTCDVSYFFTWIQKMQFTILEECIILTQYLPIYAEYAKLGEILCRTCPILWNLQTLFVTADVSHPDMLAKLTRLSTVFFYQLTQLSENPDTFKKLEELRMTGIVKLPDSYEKQILPTMPSLRKVYMKGASLAVLPNETYKRITYLSLVYCRLWNFNFNGIIQLPFLNYLSIDGSWNHLMNLDTPNLITLILRNGEQRPDIKGLDFEAVTLLPKILHLDKTLPQKIVFQLLARTGKQLEEISVTHLKRNEALSERLASALIGQKRKAPMCPLLRSIDIVCPVPDRAAVREGAYEVVKRRINERDLKGPLCRVRYGFYSVPKDPSEQELELASRKWWKVEWTELFCL